MIYIVGIISVLGEMISNQVLFQVFITSILRLIPIIIIAISIIIFIRKNNSTNNKIYELEKRINELENK